MATDGKYAVVVALKVWVCGERWLRSRWGSAVAFNRKVLGVVVTTMLTPSRSSFYQVKASVDIYSIKYSKIVSNYWIANARARTPRALEDLSPIVSYNAYKLTEPG